jgi:hypothetical protein
MTVIPKEPAWRPSDPEPSIPAPESLKGKEEEWCATCGSPKSSHPYKHMFVAWKPGSNRTVNLARCDPYTLDELQGYPPDVPFVPGPGGGRLAKSVKVRLPDREQLELPLTHTDDFKP